MKRMLLIVLSAAAAMAGPPLICHPVDIGSAKSLPWRSTTDWNGIDPRYNTSDLVTDTLAILTPQAPLPVRMETLRRASIYAAKNEALAEKLSARLVARMADEGSDPNAWFDAGYYVEALRQLAFIYKYDMLSPSERNEWKMRGDGQALDGKPWIEKAIRLGGKGMEVALVKIDEWRKADLKAVSSTK